MNYENACVRGGVFYLPAAENMARWPIVACDQYAAQKDRWEEADRAAGDGPSSLRLILPEAYLDEAETRLPHVHAAMRDYLRRGVLRPAVNGMVLVQRDTQSGSRLGLVATIDLEAYDYAPGARSLIRPTEGTIVSRIPPRLRIRRDAPLELSHVMLLLDDAKRTVIEPMHRLRDRLRPLYDVSLPLGGGRLRGWAIETKEALAQIDGALGALLAALPKDGIFLAVGDGNHSLATAKAHWQELQKSLPPAAWADHPARYATVEINNIYDDALVFEPIHRVVFGQTPEAVMAMLAPARLMPANGAPDLTIVSAAGETPLRIGNPLHPLPVGTVQALLDAHSPRLDYIHGADAVRQLVRTENAVGVLLPPMRKEMLFPAVAQGGPLPRKTFSMGEANEKRYYMEARRIVKTDAEEK